MKIGIEIQRLFRNKKYGIETSSLALIKKLQSMDTGFEFVIFAKDDEDRNCFTESENFKVKTLGGDFFADFEQIFLPLAAKTEKIDLLHCTGNTTPYFSPVPIVQTLHDIIFMDPIPRNDNLYQRVGNHYRRRLVPLVTPRSHAVVTVSQYEKDRIVSRLGIDETKIDVVYNGIDTSHFKVATDAKEKMRVKLNYGLPDKFILFLGNPSFRKNPTGVIEAYAMYASKVSNPLPLVTPGLTQKYVAHALKSLNATFDPNLYITPGYIKEEDLPIIYGLSEVFLFPSLSEGFGMPIVEAMACATPVITSKISSMPEIAGDAALLIDPMSPPSIADALMEILGDENFRQQKIKHGIANASRFSWDTTAEKMLSVYERVLAPVKKSVTLPKKNILEPALYFSNKPKP